MANISDVQGTYTFNFKNVKSKTDEEKISWIKELAELMGNVGYNTSFEDAKRLTPSSIEDNEVTLSFSASGRWTYRNNIAWFEDGWEELTDLVEQMEGVVIYIDYNEYETGCMFVASGEFTVEVKDNKVLVEQCSLEEDELNKETFVSWGFGSANEYDEMFGDSEEWPFRSSSFTAKSKK